MKHIDIPRLFGLVVLCEVIGFLSSLFMGNSVSTWYVLLNKPSWTPPNWLFAPVWITLYALMGVSLYFLVTSVNKNKNEALTFFGIQLFLNFSWSILFFGQHMIFAGLGIIVLLWIMILGTIWKSWAISKYASSVLFPYLVWVSIATYLNYSVLILNR